MTAAMVHEICETIVLVVLIVVCGIGFWKLFS